jgi:hypothetical protein
MAPEHSSGARATTAFDVYAYGMLLHELLGGDARSRGTGTTWRRCEQLIAACTAGDPDQRPRFPDIVVQLDGVLNRRGFADLQLRPLLGVFGRVLALSVALAAAMIVLAAAVLVLGELDNPVPPEPARSHAAAPPRPRPQLSEPAVLQPVAAPVRVAAMPVEPVPTSAAVPPPPPMLVSAPAVVTEPVGKRIECPAQRKRLLDQRSEHLWRDMLATLESRSCWSTTEYKRAATRASFELKLFARCVRSGDGSRDPEVVKTTDACRRRLARERAGG